MSETLQAPHDSRTQPYPMRAPALAGAAVQDGVRLAIYDDFDAVEPDWRGFERSAACTAFQAFDWLAAWHRHIGRHHGVLPAIVVGRRVTGEILFMLPLAVLPGRVCRLTWFGSQLCDYNAPLLAPDFSDRVTPDHFCRLWQEVRDLLNSRPQYRHDVIELTKMPDMVGTQRNPMLALNVGLNPNGSYHTALHASWDEFYQAKRSSASRKRDRKKRARLADLGEVKFVTPSEPMEILQTFQILMAQKTKAFARMGVGNIFARPGYRDFFLDVATSPRTRHLTHVSRLDVGATPAAVNFGLTFGGSYYHVLASYDEGEVARFGPGAAHLRELLGYAIGRGLRRFDFSIGDEPYKLEWSDRVVPLYDYVAAGTPRGWPLAALISARGRLARLVKQNSFLWALYGRLRSGIGGILGRAPVRAAPDHDEKSPSIVPGQGP